MQIDWDTVKWVLLVPATWIGKLMWSNHKSIADLRKEIAGNYPTWSDMKEEIRECSDDKDKMMKEQKEDLTYIRDKVDKIVDRMLDGRD